MPEHPKRVGDRTTLAIMLALIDAGILASRYRHLTPFGFGEALPWFAQ